MQSSPIRVSTIAFCTLATLTACQQDKPVGQADSVPDQDSGVSNAYAKQKATISGAAVPLSKPETFDPEQANSDIPSLESRLAQNHLSLDTPRQIPGLTSAGVNGSPLSLLRMPDLVFPSSSVAESPQAPPQVLSQAPSQVPLAPANAKPEVSSTLATGGSFGLVNQPTIGQPTIGQPTASEQSATAAAPAMPETAIASVTENLTNFAAQAGGTQTINPQLSDVEGNSAQDIIRTLAYAGIVQGFADGSFRPDAPISQQQFTSMVQRAFPNGGFDLKSQPLHSGTTRAEAAQIIYQALVAQGKLSPLPTTTASSSPGLYSRFSQPVLANGISALENATSTNETPDQQSPTSEPPTATAIPTVENDTSEPKIDLNAGAEVDRETVPDAETSDRAPANLSSLLRSQNQPQTTGKVNKLSSGSLSTNKLSTNKLSNNNLSTNKLSADQSLDIAVVGEVSRPGAYQIKEGSEVHPTLTQAIQMAGGVTPSADIRQVQVQRTASGGVRQTLTVDLWNVLQTGSFGKDVALQDGDTIVIPRVIQRSAQMAPQSAASQSTASQSTAAAPTPNRIQVSVVGEVNQPGKLEVQSNTSVKQAILSAGGLNSLARDKADLLRLNSDGSVLRQAIVLNSGQNINDKTTPTLRNDDVILVHRVSPTNASSDSGKAINLAP